jgi:hypothetical protein
MISGDMAREQIADRVREADAFRRSRTTRRGSQLERRSIARKTYRSFVTIIAGPFRH